MTDSEVEELKTWALLLPGVRVDWEGDYIFGHRILIAYLPDNRTTVLTPHISHRDVPAWYACSDVSLLEGKELILHELEGLRSK